MIIVVGIRDAAGNHLGVFIDEDEIVIKCKEDLHGTYVKNTQELRDLFIGLCDNYRIGFERNCNAEGEINESNAKYVEVYHGVRLFTNTPCTLSGRELTLSDLKPRTRTEYEKVTESIFDLRDEFERGELYCKNLAGNEDYQQLNTEVALFGCAAAGNVYLRVEKEIDWRDDIYEWQHTKKVGIYTPLDFTVAHLISAHPDKFLELCRVALRANGELD